MKKGIEYFESSLTRTGVEVSTEDSTDSVSHIPSGVSIRLLI